jgi:hypothetical protein
VFSSHVSPTPEDLSVQIPISIIGTSRASTPIAIDNDTLQLRRSSIVSGRGAKRVSMDPTAKGTLSFHNISYVVGGPQTNNPCKNCHPWFIKQKPGKQIINDMSGIFKSGMNAIMGKNFFKTT